jgi:Na+-transporting methylmalonyl-CoA/oxaloacetate decarboxylase beta subunit
MESILNFFRDTGFFMLAGDYKAIIMLVIACVLCYLAIVKKFEPLLLLPIAIGMLLTNLPGAEMYHADLFAGGHTNWELFGGANLVSSKDLNMELLGSGYFQILSSGDVALGNSLFGHITGISFDTDVILNAAGAVVNSAGEVLA